ncbi:MAG: nucleotidyltransferase family protein [Gammaproteobacteria bacterium]|nr:nucleotidyltransferase family protein [Gammaproteobacteria bacterium]
MSVPTDDMCAIVLAGERPGVNRFALEHGKAAGVLISVAGRSCIERVITTLRTSAAISGGMIVGPAAAVVETDAVMQSLIGTGDFHWIEPARGPSASALSAVDRLGRYPALITVGDHALLEPQVVDEFCATAMQSHADFVAGLVPLETVKIAFPESRRTILRFSDAAFCSSNLFLIKNPQGRAALRLWTRLEDDRKRPWRIAGQLGWLTLARYLTRTLSTRDTFNILSKRSGCEVVHCTVDNARAAVDIDSNDDLRLAERVLADV